MRTRVQSLALHSGLWILHCREPWCRLQMHVGSRAAVTVAPIKPLAWKFPQAVGVALKRKKKSAFLYLYTIYNCAIFKTAI